MTSNWSKTKNIKKWKYIFILSKQILPSSSFENLVERFIEK